MNTNLNSQIPSPRSSAGEGWAAIGGVIGSAFLLAKKLLSPKAAQARAGEPGRLLRRDAGHSRTASTPTTWPSWRSWTPTTGSCWPPWSGRPPASTRSKPASPAWTSARGSSHASPSEANGTAYGPQRSQLPCRAGSREPRARIARHSRQTLLARAICRPCRPRAPFHNNKQQQRKKVSNV